MSKHTRLSRAAVIATIVLATLQLFWAGVRADEGSIRGLAAFLGLLTLIAATASARTNSFEARMGTVIMACAQFGLMLLALLFGLPGHDRHPVDRQAVVALVVSATILLLLTIDARTRARTLDTDPRPPYAL
ncbi:hypothetical protein ncot_18985 [Nocardioides sp. JQ2195]|uniref:hypothetical protein n=1 Tax=Nocardioides sp. JQ2195 TaxID=2592334 RepID=UPI00143ED8B6|nr:hypothetical protein [Nocardioides sp. JQ2195]QIX28444.1 hypothetical protein ncot_18985 [Nocardioides sp. JQ2195]